MFGIWSKTILIKRIKKRDLLVKDKLNSKIRAAEGVSKLVFYAQSTGAVISGRYSRGGKLLYLMAMKREEYIWYKRVFFPDRPHTVIDLPLLVFPCKRPPCYDTSPCPSLLYWQHYALCRLSGWSLTLTMEDVHSMNNLVQASLRLCGTPGVCVWWGYVYSLLFKNAIHLSLPV